MTTPTAESLHAELLSDYAEAGMSLVETSGDWLIDVDTMEEPPRITMSEIRTGASYALSGAGIEIQDEHGSYAFFADKETETKAILLLKRIFGS